MVVARRITEMEAYDGGRDKACHAVRGRPPRSETHYTGGGVWYVCLRHGIELARCFALRLRMQVSF